MYFNLQTDTSDRGIGAVLYHKARVFQSGQKEVIVFHPRATSGWSNIMIGVVIVLIVLIVVVVIVSVIIWIVTQRKKDKTRYELHHNIYKQGQNL